MALTTCKECGGKMSDRATECPHCGCPREFQDRIPFQAEVSNKSQAQSMDGAKRQKSKPYRIIAISLVAILGVSMVVLLGNFVLFNYFGIGSARLCGWKSDNEIEEAAVVEIEDPIDEKIKNAKTIEDVRTLLNGTTWHYTENLSDSQIEGWFKVRFEDNNYISYTALPSYGTWTETERGQYKISEGRFSNTGEKYICVEWKSKLKVDYLDIPCEFALTTNNFQVRVTSSLLDGMSRIENIYSTKHYAKYGIMEFGDYVWD
ncbi:MAG: hypothetical protein J6B03_04200 [Candidatus Homeothermus sp.]|nr:hypothetical protein [Candidatus Homeothermus sp.]